MMQFVNYVLMQTLVLFTHPKRRSWNKKFFKKGFSPPPPQKKVNIKSRLFSLPKKGGEN